MPGITNPAEEYFKDGLWAWDVAEKRWLKLENDPTTNQLQVAVTNDAEVHQDAPGDLRVGAHGWDGSAWHKLPMVWGYSDRWLEHEENLTCALGVNVLTFSEPPAGEVWVVQTVCWRNVNNACSVITFVVASGGIDYGVHVENTPVAGEYYTISQNVVLKNGDVPKAAFYGCQANDDVIADLTGYKMKIAE